MANKITDCTSTEKDILEYQYPLSKQFTEVYKYDLNMHDEDANKILLAKMQAVEMYDWLNENNCCSVHIQCNFSRIQETLRFLKTLRINVNTQSCC